MHARDDLALRFADLAALEAHLRAMAEAPGEAPGLSELDHALQCAAELKQAWPDDVELQVAGLVHDVGHARGHVHHRAGAAAVRPILGERVAQLVYLHVDAKRYLVTTDQAYRARLSPVSVHTLALQGGDMDEGEIAAFEAQAHWRDGLKLRAADEAAKTPGREVPGLEVWLPALRAVASGSDRA
jgi:predicted HD phosphohydrolase